MQARSAYLDWLGRQLDAAEPRRVPARGSFGPDLVIGYATGYGVAELAPFVRSLRRWFDGRIALYVDACREDVAIFLMQQRVDRLDPPEQRSWKPHVAVQRFGAYLGGLKAYPDARYVLMSDVRDVVFQGPPLAEPVAQLEFFPEHGGDRLDDRRDYKNLRWLKRLFSERIARQLEGRTCLCAGTIIGHRAEIERLCRILLFLSAIPRSGVGGAFGADQAAYNLAAYLGLCEGAMQPNFGRVATVQRTPQEELSWDGEQVHNPDGAVSPILHKYDRHPRLAEALTERWARDLPREAPVRRIDLDRFVRHTSESLAKRLPEFR
jgi:hypothetical protein